MMHGELISSEFQPLVTVYILTYKNFDYIYSAIKSVFNQTYSNIELIISDDGSFNFPKREIETYVKTKKTPNIKNVIILDNKRNVGTVKHINNLLKYANGLLYIPLAGDDEYYDGKVISLIVERYKQKRFNVLSTSRISYNSNGAINRLYPHKLSRSIIAKTMDTAEKQFKLITESKFMDFASGSALTISADFFKEIGPFDERYILWEDGPFITKVTNMGYVIDTEFDIISVTYRLGGVSSSGHPLIKRDMQYYNSVDRLINARMFGLKHYRRVIYMRDRFLCANSLMKSIFVCLCYLDVFADRLIYRMMERRRQKFDI